MAVPKDGFVVYMGFEYAASPWFRIPQKGAEIETRYAVPDDADGFVTDNLKNIISGGPCLVRGGEILTEPEENFTDAKFTTQSLPRTAAGTDAKGKLILASVSDGCTILQLAELMRELGCQYAINLDGGAARGMYYNGAFLTTPARELSVTLQVFIRDGEDAP